jgi:DNA-binding beta-propeller fold protein YncE
MAFVLDAKTGATVARVPVGGGQHDMVFSPDGSRAVVFGFVADEPYAAYEFRASDFAPTRAITATGVGGRPVEIPAVFYGGPDRALYAVVEDGFAPDSSALAIVRVREAGAPAEPPVLVGPGGQFVASTDGRVGFVIRSDGAGSTTIDVLDLGALAVRNTIALTGELARDPLGIAPSFDGSELSLLGDVTRVRVLDTATSNVVREIRTGWEPNGELSLENVCSGGRSLLIMAVGNPCEVTVPEGAWWISRAGAARGPELACAVDTGKARFGVGDGTRLLRLGADERVATKAAIAQPDLSPGEQTIWLSSMTASPDGSRLVLFVSYGEVFCPC